MKWNEFYHRFCKNFNIINHYSIDELMYICELMAKHYYPNCGVHNASVDINYVDWDDYDRESPESWLKCRGICSFNYTSSNGWDGCTVKIECGGSLTGDDIIEIYQDRREEHYKLPAEMIDVYAKEAKLDYSRPDMAKLYTKEQ